MLAILIIVAPFWVYSLYFQMIHSAKAEEKYKKFPIKIFLDCMFKFTVNISYMFYLIRKYFEYIFRIYISEWLFAWSIFRNTSRMTEFWPVLYLISLRAQPLFSIFYVFNFRFSSMIVAFEKRELFALNLKSCI